MSLSATKVTVFALGILGAVLGALIMVATASTLFLNRADLQTQAGEVANMLDELADMEGRIDAKEAGVSPDCPLASNPNCVMAKFRVTTIPGFYISYVKDPGIGTHDWVLDEGCTKNCLCARDANVPPELYYCKSALSPDRWLVMNDASGSPISQIGEGGSSVQRFELTLETQSGGCEIKVTATPV